MAIVHWYHQNSLLISNEYEIWIAIGNPNNTSVDKCVDCTHPMGHCLHARKRPQAKAMPKKKHRTEKIWWVEQLLRAYLFRGTHTREQLDRRTELLVTSTKTIHRNVLRTKYARDNCCLTADVHFFFFGLLVRLARADNASARYTRFINNELHIEEVYRRYHGRRRRWRSSSQKRKLHE